MDPNSTRKPNEFPLTEDFLTDSPVHIYKLSDKEFERRYTYLLQAPRNYLHDDGWNYDTEKQFVETVKKRTLFSLPLPDPVSLTGFRYKDLLAVFSKMHSRAFIRAFRLCKAVNTLLNDDLTRFSIRNRAGYIANPFEIESVMLQFFFICVPGRFEATRAIRDHTSILPFTFSLKGDIYDVWNGKYAVEMLNKMKHPFDGLKIRLDLFDQDVRLKYMPWMRNAESITFGEMDTDNNWHIVEQMKPREIHLFIAPDVPLSELLQSAEKISLNLLPFDYVLDIIEKWKSGKWSYKCSEFSGGWDHYPSPLSISSDSVSYRHKDKNGTQRVLHFIPSPNGNYMVFVTSTTDIPSTSSNFSMFFNIQNLSDMINFQWIFIVATPLDYSSYPAEIDLALDPRAFCALLEAYGSTESHSTGFYA